MQDWEEERRQVEAYTWAVRQRDAALLQSEALGSSNLRRLEEQLAAVSEERRNLRLQVEALQARRMVGIG